MSLKQNIAEGIPVIKRHLVLHKRRVITLLFLSVFLAASDAAIPYFAGRLFDAINHNDLVTLFGNTFPKAFAILAVWFVIRSLGDISGWQKSIQQERLSADLDAEYLVYAFSSILFLPVSFHKKSRVGEISERIQRGATWLEQIINRVIIELLPDFLSIIIALVITFFIQPRLTLILFVAIIIYAFLLVRTAPGLGDLANKMRHAYGKAYGKASEDLVNIQAIKQAGAERHEKYQLYRFFQLKAARLWGHYMQIWQSLSFYQRLIITLTQLGIFVVSIHFIREGSMTMGQLVAFNGYAAMMFGPFVVLGRNWDVIQHGVVAIMRAEKIIQLPKEVYEPENAIMLGEVKGEVRFDNVSFSYGARQKKVLENISFEVRPGEVVALVGESGVGKSTLVDLVSHYYRPTGGHIYIDGHDVSRLDLYMLRSHIAVVPQEPLLFNDTVKNNIRYGNFSASDEEVEQAAKLAYAKDFIANFPQKYNQLVGERGIKLSVGQKQRIAIARAILRSPSILILDEPTSALDAKSEDFIQKSLEFLMEKRTTFIIAHRLSTVRKADMILVLEKGRIIEKGTHEDLLRIPKGVYRRLYEFQIGLT
ncbi:MAG: ABC transporter related protein [Parcubacteria group bacterium GW2011_GWA2_47_10]|nr:MAG: ABC transporter related protein [Parcubacteria group bacterium GW2011_GWA2_47_10]